MAGSRRVRSRLWHFVERATVGLSDEPIPIEPMERGPAVQASLPELVERFETGQIREALVRCNGDVRATLDVLGIPERPFYDNLARHGIDRSAYATDG